MELNRILPLFLESQLKLKRIVYIGIPRLPKSSKSIAKTLLSIQCHLCLVYNSTKFQCTVSLFQFVDYAFQ